MKECPPRFIPQYHNGIGWVEFIGYEKDSPYLHPKAFDTPSEAETFMEQPGIWTPKSYEWGNVSLYQPLG